MPQAYMYPKLITLEGDYDGSDFPVPGITMSGAYRQQDTYRDQKFAVLGNDDWGIFNFLRPSQAKTWLSATGSVLQLIPQTEQVGKTLIAGGQVAGAVHASYAGGSGSPPYPGTGYQPGATGSQQPPPQNKKIPWVPIVIGAGGIFAAMALA